MEVHRGGKKPLSYYLHMSKPAQIPAAESDGVTEWSLGKHISMDLTPGDGEGLMWMQLYSESAAKMTEVFQKFIIVNFMQSITPICWSLEVLLSVNIPVGDRYTNSACIFSS